MIKYILLGFLNYNPMTGYELKQNIDHSSGHFWHAYHSQIYTTLRKMEADGLVTSNLIQEESSPDRRIYTITPSGSAALTAWLKQTLTDVPPIKDELLVRLFFSAQRDPLEVLTELRLQRELHLQKTTVYHTLVEHMPTQKGLERDQVFWKMTLDMGIRFEKMYIEWLEDSIQKIETL